jgi:heptosyltransferase-2
MKLIKTPSGARTKILILRLSSIGDILLSTPFIRQVRQKFPEAKIDFIVKERYKDLLINNSKIDQLFYIKSSDENEKLSGLKRKLTEKSYDIVFDLHNNLRSNYLKRGINAGSIYSIQKGKIKQTLLVWFKINLYGRETPIPNRYLSVAEAFNVEDDGEGLELYWEKETIITAEQKVLLKGLNLKKPIIGLAPGAGFFTKRWPVNKFVELIEMIQQNTKAQVVVFGGEKDKEIGSYLNKQKKAIDLCGHLTLLETAFIISKCNIIVTNDSGLMHMGTAVQTPVLAIFGSTVRELGFFPYRSESIVIENLDINCRPCSHIGRHKCPKGHFRCMENISPDQVYTELKRFL